MVTIQTRVDAQLPPGAVLFFGDSLTAGMFTGRFGANTANYGIGFDTTAGLIRRLPLYRSLPRASAVVMMIGTNDPLFRTVDETIANHRTLLATLRGAPLLVAVGPPPVDDRSPGNEIRGNAALRRIGQALRDSCALETNCRYVDPWPILAPGDVGLPSAFHVGDGLHLNAAGYERLAQVIEAALQGAAR